MGLLLTIGGLLLVGNQLEIISTALGLTVFAIFGGIIVLITGKNLKTPSSSTERLASNLYSPQERSGLAKRATLAQTDAPKMPRSLEAAAPEARSNVTMLRLNLLVKCLNNERQVERLIEYERRFSPTVSEEQLFELAIERWERDNR